MSLSLSVWQVSSRKLGYSFVLMQCYLAYSFSLLLLLLLSLSLSLNRTLTHSVMTHTHKFTTTLVCSVMLPLFHTQSSLQLIESTKMSLANSCNENELLRKELYEAQQRSKV